MNSDIIVPLFIAFVAGWCVYKKVDFFGAFIDGAKDGLKSAAAILPALCLLMTAVGMVRASGALEALSVFLSPLLNKTHIPGRSASSCAFTAVFRLRRFGVLRGALPNALAGFLPGAGRLGAHGRQ